MEIYYCTKCEGKPYTLKISKGITCPVCGTTLRTEDVNEESLTGRPELYQQQKKIGLRELIRPLSQDNIHAGNKFMIGAEEKFHIYLGIRKTGKYSFSCNFILGNIPDVNGVITKIPVISSEIRFEERIEMTELEKARIIFENSIMDNGWDTDEMLFHVFYLNNEEERSKIIISLDVPETVTAGKAAEIYFIDYMIPSYGDISLFGKKEKKFIDSVMDIHDKHNEGYMQCMFFRAKNGDNILDLASFALSSAVLFDDPYTSVLRYDRIMKEMKMPRI